MEGGSDRVPKCRLNYTNIIAFKQRVGVFALAKEALLLLFIYCFSKAAARKALYLLPIITAYTTTTYLYVVG